MLGTGRDQEALDSLVVEAEGSPGRIVVDTAEAAEHGGRDVAVRGVVTNTKR